MSSITKEQTIGFDNDIALYDERGWATLPLTLSRQGNTADPLVVTIKFTDTLNDTAPGAKSPLYHDAVEMIWKAGETGQKEVPVRIKAGSVQTKSLLVIAQLEVPLGQDVTIAKGASIIPLRIDNQHTTKYPDRSAEYVPTRAKTPEVKETVEVLANVFIPPAA